MSEPPRRSEDADVLDRLRRVFGHPEFRPGQAEIIDHLLAGIPTLAILPTGGGKSLCYQLPGVLLDGVAVVISPLIALMRDQVEALRARGVAAASITSADSREARTEALRQLRRGALDVLYVAPERFRSESFVDRLRESKIALLAIDEAHCISEWGHDFRPDYARLGEIRRALAPERIIALTATATPEVRDDIVRSLGMADARRVVTGFDRPNLALSVEEHGSREAKFRALRGVLDSAIPRRGGGAAIVYVATRKRSEELADALDAAGWRARAYHAGLAATIRGAAQDAFATGAAEVIVATTAFGMGVDKADVRAVIHYEIPSSVEAYYQEVGRAGRDGLPARGVLLYSRGDLRFAYRRLESSCPTPRVVELAFSRVRAWSDERGELDAPFDELVQDLEAEVGPSARAALATLARAGAIELGVRSLRVLVARPEIDVPHLERRERVERSKLDAMIGYVDRAPCRRRYIVDYFGDANRPEVCGMCDCCARPKPKALEGEALIDAQKALSCVARMKGQWGKSRVAEVLVGSKSKPVLDARLDALSTHGLLAHLGREKVLGLLDALARAGLVARTYGDYPKLVLSVEGAEVLKARAPIRLDWRAAARAESPKKERAKRDRSPGAPLATVDRGPLFERLRAWRSGAARQASMPAYIVASDKVLDAICAARPDSLSALSRVPGIGPAKLERYGSEILEVLRRVE